MVTSTFIQYALTRGRELEKEYSLYTCIKVEIYGWPLTNVLFCVPSIFADIEKCPFGGYTRWLPFITKK